MSLFGKSISEIERMGWKQVGELFAGDPIYGNGRDRILVNDSVVVDFEYRLKTKY